MSLLDTCFLTMKLSMRKNIFNILNTTYGSTHKLFEGRSLVCHVHSVLISDLTYVCVFTYADANMRISTSADADICYLVNQILILDYLRAHNNLTCALPS